MANISYLWLVMQKGCWDRENTHMALWSTAAKQVNKGWVEGHDGMPDVNEVIIIIIVDNISVMGNNLNCQMFEVKEIIKDAVFHKFSKKPARNLFLAFMMMIHKNNDEHA